MFDCRKFLRKAFTIALAATSVLPASAWAAQLDIREFGARPNDGRDDSAAIESALRATRPGDTIRVPAGIYEISRTLSAPSNANLVGDGCGRSILRRSGNSGQIMLKLDGTRNLDIHGIEFDFNGAPQFYRAIGFRGQGSSDIRISDSCFIERNFRGGRGDRWAIELSATASPSRNLSIIGNTVRGNLQLTAGGGAGIIGARITGNRIVDARSNAIAISTLGNRADFRDISIARNIIETPTAIGIYVGPDKPSARGGRFSDITIADNRVSGFRNRFSYGVFVRAPAEGMSSLSITGNDIDGRGSAEPIAIRLIDDHGRGTRRFSNVRICSNTARNIGRGIWLQRVFNARVIGNRMDTQRPLLASDRENADIVTTGRC